MPNTLERIVIYLILIGFFVAALVVVARTIKEVTARNWDSKEYDWMNRPPPPPAPPESPDEKTARYRRLADDPSIDPVIRDVYADGLRADEEYRRRSPFHPDQ